MRTTITLEDEVVSDLMKFTGAPTKTGAVNRALADWVRRKRIERLKEFKGKLRFETAVEELRQLEVDELDKLHG